MLNSEILLELKLNTYSTYIKTIIDDKIIFYFIFFIKI